MKEQPHFNQGPSSEVVPRFGPLPTPVGETFPSEDGKFQAITTESLANQEKCFALGDVIYFPPYASPEDVADSLDEVDPEIIKSVTFGQEDLVKQARIYKPWLVEAIKVNYFRYFEQNKKEPDWIEQVSPLCRQNIRREHMLREYDDTLYILPSIPLSGTGGYIISEGGITQDVTNALGLGRLGEIRQLAKLTDPVTTKEESPGHFATAFQHRRYAHSLDTMAIMRLMAVRNGLDEQTTNAAIVAALAHDMYTPAGGDTTKMADPERFDEDARFAEILQEPLYIELCTKYNIDPQVVVDIVQGRHPISNVLNIADKASYLGVDAGVYLSRYGKKGPVAYPSDKENPIHKIVKNDPNICGLWDSVTLEGDRVVIEDADRLGNFLKLRALMSRELYTHPGARFMEVLIGKIIIPYLIKEKVIDPERLLEQTDEELNYMVSMVIDEQGAINASRVETFLTIEEAKEAQERLASQGVKISFIENLAPRTTGGSYFVRPRDGGDPVAFEKAYPRKTSEINKIMNSANPCRLYYLDKSFSVSDELQKAMEQFDKIDI